MPQNLRTIRRKIHTVGNIWQITRAMKMVAAARVRRFEQVVEASKLYWDSILDLAQRVATSVSDFHHPYVSAEKPTKPALVVIAGDRGLCGSYNSLVFRRAEDALQSVRPASVVPVGDRAARWAAKVGFTPAQTFPGYGSRTTANVQTNVARYLQSGYERGTFDGVYLVYTPFRSMLHNVPRLAQLLPMTLPKATGTAVATGYIFEPDAEDLLSVLLPSAVASRIAQAVIESATSEQAARMTAMTAATDNAEELRQHLTRERNRLRQQEITTEMLEIVGGANALTAD